MTTPTQRAPRPKVRAAERTVAGQRLNAIVGASIVVAYLVALGLAMDRLSYDIWGAMVIGPILLAVTIPFLVRAGRSEVDPWIIRVLIVALVAKLVGAIVRYAVTFELYAGHADAGGYHGSGSRLAAAFWDGTWDQAFRAEVPDEVVGTEFMRFATGLVYIVTGPTKLGGFLVFSWLSFLGLYWFYRAFRIGFPSGDQRRYAILVFFLPSLLFWPSSIGKEAWMLFTVGLATYGVALVLQHRTYGYLLLALGLAGTALVRPHITLLVFAALFAAYLVRRRPWRESRTGLLGRLAGFGLLILIGALVLSRATSFFNLDDVDDGSLDQVLDRTSEQSSRGDSQFEGSRPSSPIQYPGAVLTVLFRPLPWEAGNAQALAASIEGTLLLLLFLISAPRLARLPRMLLQVPYVTYAVVFTLLFVFAFSSIANFGLLARQRTQVLPLAVVVLAIPLARRDDRGSPMSGIDRLDTADQSASPT